MDRKLMAKETLEIEVKKIVMQKIRTKRPKFVVLFNLKTIFLKTNLASYYLFSILSFKSLPRNLTFENYCQNAGLFQSQS